MRPPVPETLMEKTKISGTENWGQTFFGEGVTGGLVLDVKLRLCALANSGSAFDTGQKFSVEGYIC